MIENNEMWPAGIRQALCLLGDKAQELIGLIEPYKIGEQAVKQFDFIERIEFARGADSFPPIKLLINSDSVTDVRLLVPLFRWLTKKGFRKSAAPLEVGAAGIICYAYYPFEIILELPTGNSTKGICRYIQTGIEKRPIYKLVCDE